MARKKKELTERQKELLVALGERLQAARKKAKLTGPQLAPLVGWKSPSSVSKTENGQDTDASDLLAWADACDHEVVIAPKTGPSVLASRLDRAEEGERSLALELLDVLLRARSEGDRGTTLRRLVDDIAEARERLDRHRAIDAS